MPNNADAVLERQRPLALTLPTSVNIIGCGGVGSWIAMFLALARTPKLFLWDSDIVSETNLNRLPLTHQTIATPKSLALAQMLEQLVPDVEVTPLFEWSPEAALQLGYGYREPSDNHWLVAATDTWQSRKDAFAHAQSERLHYIEASAEGEFGGVTGEPATFATDDETAAGYASVPVHVGPCVTAASLACYHILHGISPGPANYRIGWNRATNKIEFQST